MIDVTINNELLSKLAKLPTRRRKPILKELGKMEWERCADDPLYWMDSSKHWVPYVWTLDPHPKYICELCAAKPSHQDDDGLGFDKLEAHLEIVHNIKEENPRVIKGYFRSVPAVRPLPMKPYFEPIINAWLKHQLILIEKSRDMMASWLVVALYTWDTLFHEGRQNFFQSETAPKTLELVKRAYHIYKHQPKIIQDVHPFRFQMGPRNAGWMIGETLGSEIEGFPKGGDQVRQYHPSGMFTDETAFHEDAGETFAAIKPAIQNGGRYTGVSSAYPGWFMLAARDLFDADVVMV